MGESSLDNIIGVKNQVSDTTILSGLWISSVIGVAVTILFCVLQHHSLMYRYRLVAGHVRVKPPPLKDQGLISFIDWAIKSVSVSDVAFVQSCGLDALIMVKICSLGVQLFLPLCILGVVVLIPLHWTGGDSKQLDADQSGFMRLTMSNIPPGSQIFWVHVAFVYVYLAWAMVLLRWHYHQYLTIRQYYLRKGDDVNLWRALYEQKEHQATAEGGGKISNLLRSVPLIKAFMPSGVPVANSGTVTPAQESDDDDVVFPLGAMGSMRKRSTKDSLSPPGSVLNIANGGRHCSIRRSEFIVRPASLISAETGLGRRSHPLALFPVGPAGLDSAGPVNQAPCGANGAVQRQTQRQLSPHSVRTPGKMVLQSLRSEQLLPRRSIERPNGDRPGPAAGSAVSAARHGGESGGGGPGPTAAGGEGPHECAADDSAVTAAADAPAKAPPATAHVPGGQGNPPPAPSQKSPSPLRASLSHQHVADEPCGTSEVHLQLRKCRGRNHCSGGGLGRVAGGSNDLSAAMATLTPPDLEAGLVHPAAASARTASGAATSDGVEALVPPPVSAPISLISARSADRKRASAGLDPDAHLLQWWQERREVEIPLGDVETLRQQLTLVLGAGGRRDDSQPPLPLRAIRGGRGGEAAPEGEGEEDSGEADNGSGGNASPSAAQGATARKLKLEVGLDLTRPSVGHRKTVNAIYPDGTRVAVLAQHYAVLVTDVIERKAEDGHRSDKATGQSKARMGEPHAESATDSRLHRKRLASYLPHWLRSWCNLKYGTVAARKLDPMLRVVTSGDVGSRDFTSAISGPRTIHTSSLTSGSTVQVYPTPISSGARTALATALSNRRVRITIDVAPPPSLLMQHSWGATAVNANPGGSSEEPTAGQRGCVSPQASSRQPASLSRGTPSKGKAAGDRFVKLLELMARDARQKLRAQSVGSASSQRAATAAAAEGAAADATGMARDSVDGAAAALAVSASGAPSLRTTAGSPRATPNASPLSSTFTRQPEGTQPQLGVRRALPAAASSHWMVAEGSRDRHSLGGDGPVAEAPEVQEESEAGDAKEGSGTGRGAGARPAPEDAASTAAVQPLQDLIDASGGSFLRGRRSSAAAAGLSAAGPEGAGPCADAAPEPAAEGGDSGAAATTADSPVTAAKRWAFLREAVWSGDVARLPWRSRYSVVSSTFLRLFPDEYDRAIPVVDFKEVDLLLLRVDRHMAQYEYAVQYEEETGKQLFGRIGCCGLVGARRRWREYHREEINKLLAEVRKARLRALNTAHTPSWFVFFRTQRAAAMASQCLIHAEDNRQFRVHPAPGPDEVNWSALWSNFRNRDLRRNLMRPLVVLVVLFPIGIFTGALTQLDYLLCPSNVCVNLQQGSVAWTSSGCTDQIYRRESQQVTWDWYCEQKDPIAKLLKRLVVAWLPSLLLVLWQGMVLPLIFTLVVQVGREARSLSEADRCIAKNMFYFGVFNVFLGGVAGSTIFQGINSAMQKGPSEIFNLIGTYVPTSSNFFINYTMFRAFVSLPLRMLWPHIGVRMYLIRRYLRCSCIITRREQAFLMAPVSPRYGFEVGMVMIIFLVGFAFSVVSPLLLPLALVFFAISWVFWRWALLYVYVRKYEGGGTMWPFTFNRVMICMAIFPVFTACVFVTKKAYVQAIFLLVTFPVVLIRFNRYCYYRFETGLQALPLEATVLAPNARVEPWVYTPPPLLSNLAGWHPDWSKAWMGWNLPVVYG